MSSMHVASEYPTQNSQLKIDEYKAQYAAFKAKVTNLNILQNSVYIFYKKNQRKHLKKCSVYCQKHVLQSLDD